MTTPAPASGTSHCSSCNAPVSPTGRYVPEPPPTIFSKFFYAALGVTLGILVASVVWAAAGALAWEVWKGLNAPR